MRLSRILSNRRKNKTVIRSKQKHKSLDAICETTYTENRVKIESPKLSEVNGDASEVRRSSRVRRAPLVLDASPCPPEKRRRISEPDGNGSCKKVGNRDRVGLKTESPGLTTLGLEDEESGEWKSRLRARGRKVSFLVGNSSPKSKKKLFGNSNGVKKQLDNVDSQLEDKKQPGRIKASTVVSNGDTGLSNSDEDEEDTTALQVTVNGDVVELPKQGKNVADTSDSEDTDKNMAQTVQPVEKSSPAEQAESVEKDNNISDQEVTCVPQNHVEDQTVQPDQQATGNDAEDHTSNANNLQDENPKKLVEDKYSPAHRQHKPRIKQGRCCGLCGGGIDGKPPKKLVNNGGSDNESYSGSSSSEEPTYDIWDGFGDEPGWLGQLLGPINDRFGIAGIWVHQQCAVWSPEVYFAGLGCLKNVRSALCRGKVLKCSRCGRRGATIGCRVDRCPKTYHLPCARAIGCIFDHRKFLIACTDHRHLFQPHGNKYFDRLKKIKTKKMKLEFRKLSTDAWRKDHEAEEKWLENCGEDEEFLKRESKRLDRDLTRIAPVYIGGPTSENQTPYQGWESVGGLKDVIQSLKEVVIIPLLYPEFFNNIGLTPPRGVLLHGYPGTGKTLIVRSLIGSCARGDKRIAYFARKGADCLGKYVGDAERQLRLLFQVAERSQPSIIFFDEIDGLAPSRTRQQDQTHNSVVSTLLALLDGLKSRGSVVVIGATNRPDAIDPALRRPGRFDREIYFPLPSVKDREAILSLHTKKWPARVSDSLLKLVARRTVGFAGADLQALCTQTAIIALKRSCQWEKLLTAAEEKGHFGKRPVLPKLAVQERDWLEALSAAPPPCSLRESGMAANDIVSSPLPVHLFPCLIQSFSRLIVSLYLDERVSLPSSLSKAADIIKTVIVKKENSNTDCWWSRVDDLVKDADVASELESSLLRANVLSGNGAFFGSDAFNDDDTDEECTKNGFLAGKKPGFCLLISGNPRNGQRHLASCILHSFVGNAVLQKVDLATMLHEGAGDMVLGLTQMLVRCASVGSCIIFMPRIDLWAIETSHQVDEEENHISSKTILPDPSCPKQNEEKESCPDLFVGLRASDLWSSFIEQAESIFISSSLTILATTEIPFELLPPRIRDFFGKNKQNLSASNHTRTTIPRFCINVEENFNRDTVINLSAAKLLKDVTRYFVELIHHKTHIHENSFQPCDMTDADVNPNLDSDIPIEYRSKSQTCSVPPNKKEEKGKSNLMLAISTFGYQILKYPHFAELCWMTSKLKEGPFAEIDGPWKGWPFNSCIVRPVENSGNVKSKEKYGLVRGLVAVGLSAYRGAYSSLREVSGEVRKVLEVLILQINARIEGGKDRYRFARLLSQVAYLEDMVNSWAYTLQSLEAPTQPIETTTKPDSNKPTNTVPGEGDDCMEENTKTDDIATNTLDLNEDQSVNKSTPILETQGSTSFKDQTYTLLPNEVVLEHSDPKPMEHCNGFACKEESTPIPNDSPHIDPFLCVYRFCSKCTLNLQTAMQKSIISQWDPNLTTEDVDDVITSLSLNLYSTVRGFCQSHQITSVMECVSHSESSSGNGVELELVYKNGVVAVLDHETDVDFHCKFEALCLCSLTEYIVMTKHPSG